MYAKYGEIIGKTCTYINDGDDFITFSFSDGTIYQMFHEQDCCESVYLDDICGDINDLIGQPMLMAEEVDNDPPIVGHEHEVESETWTFVKMATIKGSVTFRWYGSSNGYYSERPDFRKLEH